MWVIIRAHFMLNVNGWMILIQIKESKRSKFKVSLFESIYNHHTLQLQSLYTSRAINVTNTLSPANKVVTKVLSVKPSCNRPLKLKL